jgi:hypothetical protein
MKNNILKVIFLVWVVLWASFIMRELFKKGYFYDYEILVQRSLEGKRSYVTGDRLYEFLTFCNKNLPRGASYDIYGLKTVSVDIRRAVYYLYPHLQNSDHPDFILIFEYPNPPKGYKIFVKLDNDRYILSANYKATEGVK